MGNAPTRIKCWEDCIDSGAGEPATRETRESAVWHDESADERLPRARPKEREMNWNAWLDARIPLIQGRGNAAQVWAKDFLGHHLTTELRKAVRAGKGGLPAAKFTCDLIMQLYHYKREPLLIMLAETGCVAHLLERAVATGLSLLSVSNSNVAEEWFRRLRNERTRRVDLYNQLLDSKGRRHGALGNSLQQATVQTLLKHGVEEYGDMLTPGELDVMSRAFDASVQASKVVVTGIPNWFAKTSREWDGAEKVSIPGGEEACLREASSLVELQHPNVRKFYGACHVGNLPFVVFEWSQQVARRKFWWREVLGCVRGVLYVHERGLVHQRLTAKHLLELPGERGILSGLGLTRSSSADESVRDGEVKSNNECLEVKSDPSLPSRTNDVKALGLVIFQLIAKRRTTIHEHSLPRALPNFLNYDEWQLFKGMCATDSAKRISMLDVVYQVGLLADQEKSFFNPRLTNTSLRTVVDVHHYVIPSLNMKTEEVLTRAEELCTEADTELADLHRPVLDRFVDIYRRLMEWPTSPRLCLVETFVLLLERWYCPLEHKTSFSYSQSAVSSLCASRTIAGRNYGLHHDIDRLLWDYSAEGLDSSAAVHRWRPSWEEVCRRQRQTLKTLVVEETSLASESIEDDADRSETLALLHNEVQSAGIRGGALPGLPPWFIPSHLVQLGKHLADGAFGAVYEGMYLDSPVVVKQLLTSGLGTDDQQRFVEEANLWFSLSHENLLKLFGACHVGRPFFVCERAMGGTIVAYAKKLGDPKRTWKMLREAAYGLEYLHDHRVVHGDLKGNNILIGVEWRDVLLADFGLSFATNQSDSSTAADAGALGAFRWKAPEVLQGGKATFASDIYSFGMCIIEVVTGEFPWGTSISDTVVKHNVVKEKLLPPRPRRFDDEQWKLVTRMCCYDPKERVTAAAVKIILGDMTGWADDDT